MKLVLSVRGERSSRAGRRTKDKTSQNVFVGLLEELSIISWATWKSGLLVTKSWQVTPTRFNEVYIDIHISLYPNIVFFNFDMSNHRLFGIGN